MKNKKNTSNKKAQKQDEAWKRVAPKEGKSIKKYVSSSTYHWCIHHMARGVHSAQECSLGASCKDAQKDKDKAKPKDKALSYAAAAATVANPSFATILSELSDGKDRRFEVACAWGLTALSVHMAIAEYDMGHFFTYLLLLLLPFLFHYLVSSVSHLLPSTGTPLPSSSSGTQLLPASKGDCHHPLVLVGAVHETSTCARGIDNK